MFACSNGVSLVSLVSLVTLRPSPEKVLERRKKKYMERLKGRSKGGGETRSRLSLLDESRASDPSAGQRETLVTLSHLVTLRPSPRKVFEKRKKKQKTRKGSKAGAVGLARVHQTLVTLVTLKYLYLIWKKY